GFRDFVLSRFRGEPDLMDPSENSAEQDEAWNTQVDVVIEPDVRLSAEQKA
ncbi:MAG TPA: WYL domain-containing protein, partial [Pseudomonas sp.]|nr:WYL domain-containing protein [Pseudomonas sp.]